MLAIENYIKLLQTCVYFITNIHIILRYLCAYVCTSFEFK